MFESPALPIVVAAIAGYAVFIHLVAAGALKARSRRKKECARFMIESDGGASMNLVDILDAAVDFVTIGQLNGRPLYVNPAARRALGIGLTEQIPAMVPFRPQGFAEFLETTILPTLERGEAWTGDTEYLSRTGTVIPVSQVSVGHRNASGDIQFISTISRNITEQRRQGAALGEASERTQFALQAGRAAICEVDLRSGAMTWSETSPLVLGGSSGDSPASVDAFLERVRVRERDAVRNALATPEGPHAFEFDARIEWPDRTTHWIHLHGQVLGDPEGRPARVLALAHDVTDHKELELQLRQAQKMEAVGQLAGGVAHDFNNLLMAIIGYSQLALDQLGPSHAVHADLQEVRKAGETAASLTRQLLTFSRKESAQPIIVGLGEVVGKLLPMLRRLLGEHVEIVEAHDEARCPVLADPGQLEQIVMNLAVNARDAMPRGGRLTIGARQARLDSHEAIRRGLKPGAYGVLDIRDTGTGMDAATRERIFEPFFTTKAPGVGTGLGLATVYRIVHELGGAISVDSAPGQGALFTIFLPRAVDGAAQAASPSTPRTRGSETLLLVEDDPAVRGLIGGLLKRSGYQVLVAEAPERARQIAAEAGASIDMVIADVMMPGGTGSDLLTDLRRTCGPMPALFMSGYERASLTAQGTLDPESAFIQKPFTGTDFLKYVRRVLERTEVHSTA